MEPAAGTDPATPGPATACRHLHESTAIGDNLKDIILFDGRSVIVDSAGEQTASAPLFQENLCIAEPNAQMQGGQMAASKWTEEEEIYSALTFALREYCRQTGFERALLGISGGDVTTSAFSLNCTIISPCMLDSIIVYSRLQVRSIGWILYLSIVMMVLSLKMHSHEALTIIASMKVNIWQRYG